ncbi:hypothetical protein [Rhizobium halophilum]|uniref:hypothetical protein n=1 Tax=Rhizobium halophilum TaxID=2846852 RepID=UPI001EFE9C47|nr:hypothetical protein [Rhizobium halophilum]MCF6368317.1 hypothetical protein [Rhizobium halophilum]
MNTLLPIIEQLAACRTDPERIDWLLRCPFAILRKYDFTIRNWLQIAGFRGGDDYLDAVRISMSAVRNADGFWEQDQYDLLTTAIDNMRRLAMPDVPPAPPDPTEL